MLETRTHNLEGWKQNKTKQWRPLSHKEQSRVRNSFLWYFGTFLGFSTDVIMWLRGSVYPHPHLYPVYKQSDWTHSLMSTRGLRHILDLSSWGNPGGFIRPKYNLFKLEDIDLWFHFFLSKNLSRLSAWDYRCGILLHARVNMLMLSIVTELWCRSREGQKQRTQSLSSPKSITLLLLCMTWCQK